MSNGRSSPPAGWGKSLKATTTLVPDEPSPAPTREEFDALCALVQRLQHTVNMLGIEHHYRAQKEPCGKLNHPGGPNGCTDLTCQAVQRSTNP